jgi:hypothetical protein
MSGSSGVGGTTPTPEEIPGLGEVEGMSKPEISDMLHTGISSLDQLKQVLISYMGEEKGMKFYNQFMLSFAMQTLTQMQHSTEQAKQAAQSMRQNTQ